jgi:steroid delta-isomerase-like uncharacterized protein
MSTPKENAAACREFTQRVFNDHDFSFAEKMMAESFISHSPPPGYAGDKASTIKMFREMAEQVPDARTEIVDLIATDDRVAVRSRISGTDANGFMPGVPATGKSFSMESIDVLSFDENGQNTEHYGIADVPGAMRQLGLMPAPGAS